MATRTIKTRLELDGEAAYNKQLKEIGSGMGVLKSEMKAVSAEFATNGKSVEALNAKNDVLNRQILTQKEKIETLRAALSDAAQAYGEADSRTQSWQIKLNNAQAELYKMENELDNNNKALEEAAAETKKTEGAFSEFTQSSKGLGDVLGDIAGKLGVNIPGGAKDALNSLGSMNGATAAAAAGFAALVAAIIEAEKALWSMTKESAAAADEILTLSMQTGLSTTALQEWAYASELIDVDIGTLRGSMTKLAQNMDKARSGNEELAAVFTDLGISITDADGNLRSIEDVFYEAIDAMGEIQNSAERDAVAMAIFGKGAQELNPLIIQGTDTLREYTAEAHEMAAVLTDEQLDALGAVDDAQQRLLNTQKAVSDQISAEYAPYMTEALNTTRDCIQEIGKALIESGAVDAFGSILTSATSLLEPIASLATEVLPLLADALKPIAGLIAWIADAANAAIAIFTLDFGKFNTAMGLNPNQASNMQRWMYGAEYKSGSGSYYNAATGMYEGNYFYNASGDANFSGGLTWVGENGPELVNLPRGSSIYTNQESRSLGGDVFNITIDAKSVKEFNDIIETATNARRLSRMGGAAT